jgi:hypothetical protein
MLSSARFCSRIAGRPAAAKGGLVPGAGAPVLPQLRSQGWLI